MSGKIIVSAVSLILVVGVAIGVIVAVNQKNNDPEVQAQQKYVRAMCQDTDDQKLCHETLSSVKGASVQDPKAYVASAVKATMDSVIKAFNMSDNLSTEYADKDKGIKTALDDCKDLLQYAMDSLELSTNLVRDNDIHSIYNQSPDIRNWLSAVISYQQTCMESFDDGKDGEQKMKEQLNDKSLDHVGKITGITLDIVTGLSKILEQFNLKLDLKPTSSRRLLGMEVDSEGYPTWLSAADRKLLGNIHKKGKGKGKGKGRGRWRGRGRIPRGPPVPANAVVAQDGSGQFKTITDAINSYPKGHQGRYIIYVKAGVYNEYITVPKTAVNILMYGDGPTRTIVTGRKNFAEGVKTMQTASFANTANGFIAKSMRFENTAGPSGHQAVALRNQGDMSAFFDCHIFGYQDTLYVQTNRQFFRNCEISGTIDFIFGMSTTLIQSSRIIVRKPNAKQFNTVTADGTTQKNMATGIVLQNCEIVPEMALFPERFAVKSYLGRPWKDYSKTVIMESTIGDFLQPEGWFPWEGNKFLNTLYYAEHANSGPGAAVDKRVNWKGYHGLISKQEAAQFTAGQFLKAGPNANAEEWLKFLQIPFDIGFTKP